MKKRISLMVGMLAVAFSVSAVQAAETRLAVQDAGGTTDQFAVTDSGWVGIGTKTNLPISPIHVISKGSVANGTNFSEAGLNFQYTASGSAPPVYMAPNFSLYRNNDDTTNGGRPRIGDSLGYFGFGSVLGASLVNKALMYAKAEATWSSDTDTPSFIQYMTNPGGGINNREILRLSSNTARPLATVNGGLRLYPNTGTGAATDLGAGTNKPIKPSCDASLQGTMWFTIGISAKDSLEVCANSDATGTNFAWRTIY